ncbi:hypothetical protein VTN00DRAFT_6093 [Thermoascus crustaceus]|uniref:uncharacterized protein n=1 Tax=Thermoascus crustaceus TaxID=5088 RepID=UPI0037445211
MDKRRNSPINIYSRHQYPASSRTHSSCWVQKHMVYSPKGAPLAVVIPVRCSMRSPGIGCEKNSPRRVDIKVVGTEATTGGDPADANFYDDELTKLPSAEDSDSEGQQRLEETT